MKRNVLYVAVVLALAAIVIGCGSPPPPPAPEPAPAPAPAPTPQQAPSGLPDFYLNPPVAADAIFGVGSAKMASLDNSRRMAIARAREDIAFQMNASIQAAIVDYAQESGVDGGSQVITFVETISRQVTDTTLDGTRQERVEQGPDGTVYALVSYPRNQFAAAASQAFQRNEDAAFAEFKADQALQFLDRTLQNNPTQAGNVR